jgi:replicative DNA helicase
MGKDLKFSKAEIANWIDSGELNCYEVLLEDNISVKVSETHPFYTTDGWKQIKDLKSNDFIAIPSILPDHEGKSSIDEYEAIIIAALLAEGGLTSTTMKFTNTDPQIINCLKESINKKFPIISFQKEGNYSFRLSGEGKGKINPLTSYMKELDLYGLDSHKKFIPQDVFRSSNKIIGKFLGMFWACDGWASKRKEEIEIGISLCNYNMVRQIRSLLLRFGIRTKILDSKAKYTGCEKEFKKYTIVIRDIDNIRKFYNNIHIGLDKKQGIVGEYLNSLSSLNRNGYHDSTPIKWLEVKTECSKHNFSFEYLLNMVDPVHRTIQYDKTKNRYKIMANYRPSNEDRLSKNVLRTIGFILNKKDWIAIADGDIHFSQIKQIKYIGKRQCYDLEIPNDHNFIANDIVVHNTALLCKLAYSIASNNEDVIVIYHTIDDTFEQLTPRFIAIAEESKSLTMNMVRQPHYWSQVVNIPNINDKRNLGYTKVRELAQQGRLVVKDIKHGSTLPFIENLICYYKDKCPEKRVVFILDNFHKLRDFAGSKDERVRFKALSESVKAITLRHRCCFIATVEYTKLPSGVRPTNNSLAESVQLEYDASVILHLYSDVADNPHSFSICHESLNHNGEKVFLPRVECIIGKNKITEIKKSFFLDFWPASSDFSCVNQKKVLQESERMKKMVKDGSFNQLNNVIDDMDDLY